MEMVVGPTRQARLCCIASGPFLSPEGHPYEMGQTSLEDIWNSKGLRSVRKRMLQGEKIRECSHCHYLESVERKSYRQSFNDYWLNDSASKEEIKRRIEVSKEHNFKVNAPPIYLDIRPGNKCNLKCRMCNPGNSSLIFQEQRKLFKERQLTSDLIETDYFYDDLKNFTDWYKQPHIWKTINSWIPQIKQLYFTGGEPTLIKQNWDIIDMAIEKKFAKNISLIFNINSTNIPDKLVNTFDHFHNVSINLSIDGYGAVQEYIRAPSKWEKIEKNIRYVISHKRENVSIVFTPVIQVYNILYLTEFLRWRDALVEELQIEILIDFLFCTNPDYLDIASLPKGEVRKQALDDITNYKKEISQGDNRLTGELELNPIENILRNTFLNDLPLLRKKFFHYTRALDKNRNDCFEESLPRLAKYMEIESLPSSTFCILPWVHMAFQTSGDAALCCVSPPLEGNNISDKSLNDIFNGKALRNLRMTMLKGEKHPLCSRCHEEEKLDIASHRLRYNKRWKKMVDFPSLVEQTDNTGRYKGPLRYLDLRLGNTCNLECNICSPSESSRWEKLAPKMLRHVKKNGLKNYISSQIKRIPQNKWYQQEQFKTDLYKNIPNLKQITIAGGEPLLIKEHHEFLDECIRQKEAHHISIHYHTNGTLLNAKNLSKNSFWQFVIERGLGMGSKLFNQWRRFDHIMVFLSLDDLGDRNHYIRYPSDWGKMSHALHFLDKKTPRNVQSMILCTIQALNIFYFPEFVSWIVKQKFRKVHAYYDSIVHTELVHGPEFLSCQILPKEVKKIITEKFQELYKNHNAKAARFKTIIDFMNKEDRSYLLPTFKDHLQAIDKVRGTDVKKTFPELMRLL